MPVSPDKIAADLAEIIRGDVFSDILHRTAFSTDSSIYQITPLCVIAPRDGTDVAAAVRYAAANNIPVVARGAGSGLAGEALGSGIVFDMTRYMNKILYFSTDEQSVTCEPGVVLDDLNNYLAKYGRKIGPDPSSGNRSTVGGIVANNSTGAHSLQYGYTADYVESIEAVLTDGSLVEIKNNMSPEEIRSRTLAQMAKESIAVLAGKDDVIAQALPKTKRNRCGYNIAGICHNGRMDLARLMAGSEGTLAIFTKITLRTVAVPPVKALIQFEYDSLEKMGQAVPIIVDTGVSTCDVMDKNVVDMAIEALPEYRDILPAGAAAVLLVEHTAQTRQQVEEKIKRTVSAAGNLAYKYGVFFGPEEQKRLWKSRKEAVPLLFRMKDKKHPVEFIEDIVVDNKKLVEYLAGLEKVKKRYNLSMSCYGHPGDGELHIRPNLDLRDAADLEKMRLIADEVFELVWSLGGSISGEHADGLLRAAFIKRQYGPQYYEMLCKIKQIFDPDGLMNPGKIINSDPDIMTKNLRKEYEILPERLGTSLFFDKDELELELEQCSGCGACLSREPDLRICPVFRALGEELGSPRAKANILRCWATGQLEEKDFESTQFRKFLDLCINCKACSLQCPSGVDVSKLITNARAEYAGRKGLRRTETALSHNRYLSILGSIFSPVANAAMKSGIFKWLLEKTVGVDKRRQMPDFEGRSFLRAGHEFLASCRPIEKPADKVAYFVDTYANYNDHELGFAVIDVLRRNNIEVILPKQRPVPLPAVVYGDIKTARRDLVFDVKHLAKAVRKGYKIVCSEPSAVLCLKQELRHFVSGADAELVSKNTFELMSYLLGLFKAGKLKQPEKAALQHFIYHRPCHLMAINGNAGVELLRGLCGAWIDELKAGCCGLAGTFGMQEKNYDLSSKIAEQFKQSLGAAPADYVLTECAACKMQIEHLTGRGAIHPIKILAECYNG